MKEGINQGCFRVDCLFVYLERDEEAMSTEKPTTFAFCFFFFGLGVSRHDFLLLLALTQGRIKTMEIQWKFHESLGLEVKGCYWQKRCMILDFLHAFIATCTVNSCFRFAIAFRKALAAGLQGSLLYWNHRSLY